MAPATVPPPKMKYKFFNPELRRNTIPIGDAYDDEKRRKIRRDWAVEDDKLPRYPYLSHVKELAKSWPHLEFLADFMEHGTPPIQGRWSPCPDDPAKVAEREAERVERATRTRVCQLRYDKNGTIAPSHYKKPGELAAALQDAGSSDEVKLRLFVVEDLSREVIEHLGHHFDIEPAFFREHIVDYAWYNVRDPWRDPPNLDVVARDQHWAQIRFVRARYFESEVSFKTGFDQSKQFNVARRPDDDENNKAFWDKKGAKIGMTRTKASLWMKKVEPNETAEGVLLLDPTIEEGYPLWRGYRNWTRTPSGKKAAAAMTPAAARQKQQNGVKSEEKCTSTGQSFYEDFLHWAQRPDAFAHTAVTGASSAAIHVPSQALLHLVCAEWYTLADYIKTRLNQIDWEIAYPEHFLFEGSHIDIALKKLHIWRRSVPLYREMLAETFLRIFHTPILTGISEQAIRSPPSPTAAPVVRPDPLTGCHCFVHDAMSNHEGSINAYRRDFALALSYMEEHQQRIDRLTAVVTAAIGIGDSRRGYSDNKNLGRLTLLATIFIPLSFVATLFSMTEDVTQLNGTFIQWAKVSVPFAGALVCILALPTFPLLLKSAKGAADGFPWVGKWRPFRTKE